MSEERIHLGNITKKLYRLISFQENSTTTRKVDASILNDLQKDIEEAQKKIKQAQEAIATLERNNALHEKNVDDVAAKAKKILLSQTGTRLSKRLFSENKDIVTEKLDV